MGYGYGITRSLRVGEANYILDGGSYSKREFALQRPKFAKLK